MTEDELIQLLSAHEWNDVEFKEAQLAVPKNAYETVSAFSNTAGGHLIFGVRKKGKQFEVVGVLDVDKVQNEFITTLRQKDKLNLIINVEEQLRNVGGNDLLVFYVPEAARTDKPVYLNQNFRKAFLRKGGADVHCSSEELRRLINDASTDRYDGHVVDFDLQTCFDPASLSWYRNIYEQKPGNRSYADKNNIDFLSELGLLRETQQGLKASRAAILLFGRDGSFRDLMPRPVVDCQRFEAAFGEYTPGLRWADRVVLDFNLIQSWRALLDWYQKIAITPFRVEPATMQRTDMPPDYIAFREAVINMLIHQDYADHSRKPELLHFTDRTIFWNPGDAFSSFVDLLEPGQKEVRSPRIVTAFRRIGLSENAGWGLRDVFTNWQQLGNFPPVILNDKANKTFQLTLPKELLLSEEQIVFQGQLGVHLDPEAARLFAYICRKKEISAAEAKAVLAQSTKQSLVKLRYLVTQALVREIEPELLYGLAEHLLARFPSDQVSDQVSVDQGERLVTQPTEQPPVTGQHRGKAPEKLELSAHQRKIILLGEIPRSAGDLLGELGLSHRTFFRSTILEPLLKNGLIKQTHPEQPNHPKQTYVLTEAGLRLLELIKSQAQKQPDGN